MTKCISHSILRVLALTVLLMITTSVIPKTAAAATAVVGLGCSASSNGGNLTIPISSSVGEGDTILIAVQVVARNEDLVGITDAVGNTYTRLVKHLGIVIGPEGLEENDTHHVYAAFDASALNSGQPITVRWEFSNALEACVVKISGLYQSPFDQSASAHTNNTSPDSGNTVTTSLADEVLIGTFGWFCFPNSPCNADATAGAGYTEAIEGQDVMIEHRTVNTTGTYNANATLSASSDWNAAIVTFKVDTTPPVITPQVSGTVGQNGWYTSNVVVSWTVTDPESRVISTCSPTTISADTAGVQVTCNATSAGGTSTESITVKRDATPPTITATAAPAPNGNGWNNSDVTVSFTCADAMSGLVGTCPANQVLSTEGSTVNSTPQTVSDQAGNSVSSNVITVKIDKSAPVVSVIGVSDGATYDPDNVPTASCSTTDALSGVATQATVNVSGGNPDGTGSFTATCSGATDLADNSAAPVSVSYSVTPPPDTTAPVITPNVVGTLGANGWYVSDVTVSWTVVDDESAISSQDGCDPVTVNADTAGVTVTCSVTSAGGSSSESVTVKRDATAPIVTVTGVSDGASYTLGSVPTAACDTSDTTSGVATQATVSVTGGGGPQGADGTGSFTATCSGATDIADNSADAVSVSYSVTPPPDTTAPVITAQVNGTLGANGWYVSDVEVTWTVVDAESAISNQSGCEPQNITGDTVGDTFTCTAASAGGSSNESVTVKRDATAPVVTVTGVSDGASYPLGSVPTAACETSDALSGVATEATLSVTGGNGDGTGAFTATCSGATDNASNSAAPTSVVYTVAAQPPAQTLRQQVESVRATLTALLPSGNKQNDKRLRKAVEKLDKALAPHLWQADGNHLTLLGDDLFNRLYNAVKELSKLKNPPQPARTAMHTLATISRTLAQIALDEAIAGQGNAQQLAKAQSRLSKGDQEAAKGNLYKAIAYYEDAWEYAQQALGLAVATSLSAEEIELLPETEESMDDSSEADTLNNQLFLPLVTR